MSATYDPTVDVGKVRLLAGDVPDEQDDAVFDDDEIDAFLALADGDVRRAAATCLRANAANEALLAKRIRLQDVETDGPAVARELRQQADALDARADQLEREGGDLDWAPIVASGHAWRERVWNERRRDS